MISFLIADATGKNDTPSTIVAAEEPTNYEELPKSLITIGVLLAAMILAVIIAKAADACYDRRSIRDDASDISEHTKDLLKLRVAVGKFRPLKKDTLDTPEKIQTAKFVAKWNTKAAVKSIKKGKLKELEEGEKTHETSHSENPPSTQVNILVSRPSCGVDVFPFGHNEGTTSVRGEVSDFPACTSSGFSNIVDEDDQVALGEEASTLGVASGLNGRDKDVRGSARSWKGFGTKVEPINDESSSATTGLVRSGSPLRASPFLYVLPSKGSPGPGESPQEKSSGPRTGTPGISGLRDDSEDLLIPTAESLKGTTRPDYMKLLERRTSVLSAQEFRVTDDVLSSPNNAGQYDVSVINVRPNNSCAIGRDGSINPVPPAMGTREESMLNSSTGSASGPAMASVEETQTEANVRPGIAAVTKKHSGSSHAWLGTSDDADGSANSFNAQSHFNVSTPIEKSFTPTVQQTGSAPIGDRENSGKNVRTRDTKAGKSSSDENSERGSSGKSSHSRASVSTTKPRHSADRKKGGRVESRSSTSQVKLETKDSNSSTSTKSNVEMEIETLDSEMFV